LRESPPFHSKSTHLLQWITTSLWTIAFEINRNEENKMLPTMHNTRIGTRSLSYRKNWISDCNTFPPAFACLRSEQSHPHRLVLF
jgi:hypothetical protein